MLGMEHFLHTLVFGEFPSSHCFYFYRAEVLLAYDSVGFSKTKGVEVMSCCGPSGACPPGMQNCNMPGMTNNRVNPQAVRTTSANQNVPPELAAFIQQLGLGQSNGTTIT
jgi:hypothetical protein